MTLCSLFKFGDINQMASHFSEQFKIRHVRWQLLFDVKHTIVALVMVDGRAAAAVL